MGLRIIAVDDEKAAQFFMEEAIMAAKPDCQLQSFDLPNEAIEYVKSNPVDVAFLDIEMPQMNGVELAEKLIEINPKINIIFATAYPDFGLDAMKIHASGYVLKPVSETAVKKELDNLRNPVENKDAPRVKIECFGAFELFVDGVPVKFARTKAKECLAVIVDKAGQNISRREIAVEIFEDREYDKNTADYMSKITREMERELENHGALDILRKDEYYFSLDTSKVNCDYLNMLSGDEEAKKAFNGVYMSRYTWAEDTVGRLCKISGQFDY